MYTTGFNIRASGNGIHPGTRARLEILGIGTTPKPDEIEVVLGKPGWRDQLRTLLTVVATKLGEEPENVLISFPSDPSAERDPTELSVLRVDGFSNEHMVGQFTCLVGRVLEEYLTILYNKAGQRVEVRVESLEGRVRYYRTGDRCLVKVRALFTPPSHN